jgi:hypothetical protein
MNLSNFSILSEITEYSIVKSCFLADNLSSNSECIACAFTKTSCHCFMLSFSSDMILSTVLLFFLGFDCISLDRIVSLSPFLIFQKIPDVIILSLMSLYKPDDCIELISIQSGKHNRNNSMACIIS